MPRLILTFALLVTGSPAFAQPGPPPDRPGRGQDAAPDVDRLVDRLLTFDANKDGSLAKSELTDERLHALFDRADANSDGTATRAELKELLAKETAALAAMPRRGGPMGGGPAGGHPGAGGPPRDNVFRRQPERGPDSGQRGPGGPPDEFRRGPGGDARGQRPRPGQILPPGAQQRLNLSDDQRRRIDALQEIVDTQLDKILTPEQKQMLNDFGPPQGPPDDFGRPRGDGPPRDRQRPNTGDRPQRPASEP